MLGQGQERSSRDLNLKRRAELVVDVLTATHAISTLTHRQRIVEQPHMSADSRVGASRGSDRDRIDSRLRSWSRFLVTAVAIVGSAYNGTTQAADDPSKELGCGDTYTEALAIGRIANNAWRIDKLQATIRRGSASGSAVPRTANNTAGPGTGRHKVTLCFHFLK